MYVDVPVGEHTLHVKRQQLPRVVVSYFRPHASTLLAKHNALRVGRSKGDIHQVFAHILQSIPKYLLSA